MLGDRYRVVAQIIRENGGAVVAEQLAPFLDPPEPKADAESYTVKVGEAVVDESFMLPVLTRLNGRPEVTEEGQIVYVFPELMTSAGKRCFSSTLLVIRRSHLW